MKKTAISEKSPIIDMKGGRYGKLTVISFAGMGNDRNSTWLVRCDCGSPDKIVGRQHLIRGLVKSCGCNRKSKYATEQERLSAKKIYQENYRNNNKIRAKELNSEWRKNNPDKIHQLNLKRYNLSIEEYNALFQKQNGRCAICGKHQTELTKKLNVDHCHETNIVRGLLCVKCNTALGLLKDDTSLFSKAISYLEKNNKKILLSLLNNTN